MNQVDESQKTNSHKNCPLVSNLLRQLLQFQSLINEFEENHLQPSGGYPLAHFFPSGL